MAHYAFLDSNNVVTHVIVGRDEDDLALLPDGFDSWETYYADRVGQVCKRTSYNTHGNQHADDKVPFRGNYAGIGFTYDEARDAFIHPQPFPSWTFDEASLFWVAPVPKPDDGQQYLWDEDASSWVAAAPEPS